jgi:hypothetical protein
MIWPFCSWTSQHRIPESQFPDTRKFAVGLHVRLLTPSFPACATLWSVVEIALERAGAAADPIPNVDMAAAAAATETLADRDATQGTTLNERGEGKTRARETRLCAAKTEAQYNFSKTMGDV